MIIKSNYKVIYTVVLNKNYSRRRMAFSDGSLSQSVIVSQHWRTMWYLENWQCGNLGNLNDLLKKPSVIGILSTVDDSFESM